MDDELILPESDAPITPANAPTPAKPRPRKTAIFVALAAVVFVALATSLIIIITGKSTTPEQPVNTTDDTPPTDDTEVFYYDQEEFTEALDHAFSCLEDKNYSAVSFYLQPYSATERMTAVQKYRFYSVYAEMYSEAYLNNPELAQKYSALVSEALKSMREGEN